MGSYSTCKCYNHPRLITKSYSKQKPVHCTGFFNRLKIFRQIIRIRVIFCDNINLLYSRTWLLDMKFLDYKERSDLNG